MNSTRSIAVALALFASLSACNAILGNSEVKPTSPAESTTDPVGDRPGDDQDGSTAATDASTNADATAPEAGKPDRPDAGPTDAGPKQDASASAGNPAPAAGKTAPPVDAGSCTLPEREEMREDCGECKNGKRIRARIRKRTSQCTWGEWEAWGECQGPAEECKPGSPQTAMQVCGNCNTGMQTRTRSCSPTTCTWGEYGAWSDCTGASTECKADDVQTMQVDCGPCNTGKAVRTRTCSPTTCTWGEYGSAGECTGITAQCRPTDTTACTSGTCRNGAGNNTCPSCGQRVCQDNCTWGPCVSRVAGGCLDDHWRCCGSGRWQWCDPSSCNFYPCDSCQGDAECLSGCP